MMKTTTGESLESIVLNVKVFFFAIIFRGFHSNYISIIPDGAFAGNPLLRTM